MVLLHNMITHFHMSLTILIIPYPDYLLVFILQEQSTFNTIHQVTTKHNNSVVIHFLHSSSQQSPFIFEIKKGNTIIQDNRLTLSHSVH